MSKMSHSFTLSLILLLSFVSVISIGAPATSPVHNLDTALDYATIQAAINAPETLNGHTIQVDAGTYYENVLVNKSISLIGEDNSNTIVDGGKADAVITLTANNITISNFTIRNSSTSGSYYGLLLNGCNNTIVQNNKITQNYMGLVISQSSSNLFRNNTMDGNVYNFAISGSDIIDWDYWTPTLEHFLQDMDTSNTVEGNPIYYWINHENEQVPSDAGCVVLVNCTYITVENLNLGNSFHGLLLAYSSNSTIKNNNVTGSYSGIGVYYGSYFNQITANNLKTNDVGVFGYGWDSRPFYNSFIGNTVTENGMGLYLWRTYYNLIQENDITSNQQGIRFWATYNSSVYENKIQDNNVGIAFDESVRYNELYHNNVVNNTVAVSGASGTNTESNSWDDGFPSGGNFWSDYSGIDANGDGIGDTPYVIDVNNQDNYPLMEPFDAPEHIFGVTVGSVTYPVSISTNSSIYEFNFNAASNQTSFKVTGMDGTAGFCNITVPEELMSGDFSLYLDDVALVEGVDYTESYNGTHYLFSITYEHSSHVIALVSTNVIPDFAGWLFLPFLMFATLLALMFTNKLKKQRKPIHSHEE